jgi:hypothetical protein
LLPREISEGPASDDSPTLFKKLRGQSLIASGVFISEYYNLIGVSKKPDISQIL